jgi:hypothetical protein
MAGGVNAPIGSAFGDQIGKQIHDEHKDLIQHGLGDINSWMKARAADLGL